LVAFISTIPGFRSAFDLGLRYYPIKKGINLLFQKDGDGDTPFQLACDNFGRDEVMKVIEDTLLLSSQQQQEQRAADDDDDDDNSNNFVGPYNIIDAFMMAAMDEQVHFDCVYFLLRRQPDLLQRLLSGSMTNNDNVIVGGGGGGGHGEDNDDDDDDYDYDYDDAAVDNGNGRNDDSETHDDCKKDDDDNGNFRDTGIESHVKRKNDDNDDANNENNGDNKMLSIDANSNADLIPNATANLDATANHRKRRRKF